MTTVRTRHHVYSLTLLLLVSLGAPCYAANSPAPRVFVAELAHRALLSANVAGVSMALAQREEFAAVLQRNGGDLSSLIRQLQVKMSAQQ
jgi:hypothetical protein